jgi:hypothetical protein
MKKKDDSDSILTLLDVLTSGVSLVWKPGAEILRKGHSVIITESLNGPILAVLSGVLELMGYYLCLCLLL